MMSINFGRKHNRLSGRLTQNHLQEHLSEHGRPKGSRIKTGNKTLTIKRLNQKKERIAQNIFTKTEEKHSI